LPAALLMSSSGRATSISFFGVFMFCMGLT
jgi:hypothetical protein